MTRSMIRSALLFVLLAAVAMPAVAQSKVAVIDVQRVVTESDPGKEVMQRLKALHRCQVAGGPGTAAGDGDAAGPIQKQRFTSPRLDRRR